MSLRTQSEKTNRELTDVLSELSRKVKPFIVFALVLLYATITLKSFYVSPVFFWTNLNAMVIIGLVYLIHSIETKK